MRSLVERVVVGPAGADIRLRLEGLSNLVHNFTGNAAPASAVAA
ncbi:hypothetical protein GCM10011504_55630 [Siccirubricoccus deserti]|nr:hypothetical protein [Siccirubricoccus deserti]GGC70728.1 hypothetical protein GCM10011504_55630 [Siccirubricoccus deserti]